MATENLRQFNEKRTIDKQTLILSLSPLFSFTNHALVRIGLTKLVKYESGIDFHSRCIRSNSSDTFRGYGRSSRSLLF